MPTITAREEVARSKQANVMLSRVAGSLYWMSRYLERAENQARLIDVNLQILLDFGQVSAETLKEHWLPVLRSSGDDEQFLDFMNLLTMKAPQTFSPFASKTRIH